MTSRFVRLNAIQSAHKQSNSKKPTKATSKSFPGCKRLGGLRKGRKFVESKLSPNELSKRLDAVETEATAKRAAAKSALAELQRRLDEFQVLRNTGTSTSELRRVFDRINSDFSDFNRWYTKFDSFSEATKRNYDHFISELAKVRQFLNYILDASEDTDDIKDDISDFLELLRKVTTAAPTVIAAVKPDVVAALKLVLSTAFERWSDLETELNNLAARNACTLKRDLDHLVSAGFTRTEALALVATNAGSFTKIVASALPSLTNDKFSHK